MRRRALCLGVAGVLLPSVAFAQSEGAEAMGLGLREIVANAVGLLFSCGCCGFWVLLLLASVFSALRVSRLFSWIWEYSLPRALEERLQALWARFVGRRRTEQALRQRGHNPRDSKARYNLGVLYMEQRRWIPAIEELRASVEINPERADAHFRLGQCLTSLRRPVEAREALEQCLAQRADHTEGQLLIARVLLDLAEPGEARRVAAEFVDRHREDAEGWLLLGLALVALREPEGARDPLGRAVECARHASPVNRARYRRAARAARAALARLPRV